MKFEIDRRVLEAGLSKVTGAIGAKSTMPVLSNVLLDFDGTALRIAASDLEISIETKVHARGVDKGRTTAPAKKLLDISRSAATPLLSVETTETGRMIVKSGRSRFEIPVIEAADFPMLDFTVSDKAVKFDPFVVTRALERVDHAIPKKEDGFTAAGVLMHRKDSDLRFVASDGYRLVYAGIEASRLEGIEIDDSGIIIPLAGAGQIVKILDKAQEARIEASKERVLIVCGETALSCRLLDNEFPDYEMIIPVEPPFSALISREELGAALKRLSAFTNLAYRHLRLKMLPASMEMEAGSPEEGTAQDAVEAQYDGPEFETAYNLDYLRQTVAASASERIRFVWVDQFHGGIWLDPEDDRALDLIMPTVV